MQSLVKSPWVDQFDDLVSRTKSSLLVCSPYVGRGPCDRLAAAFRRPGIDPPVSLLLLTDLSRDNMLSGATDVVAIASLVQSLPQTVVRVLPRLHAKVYVSDDREAVVTSGNLTEGGLRRNFEYGVRIDDSALVAQVRSEIMQYSRLGSEVTLAQLQAFATVTRELRAVRAEAESSMRKKLRVEFDEKLKVLDEAVLRVRVAGRSLDAILSEAILFLLRDGPRTTPQIHVDVQRIHPDLCDDTVDRVIDGISYGKKWKHAVRRAQYHLKSRGAIKLEHGLWSIDI